MSENLSIEEIIKRAQEIKSEAEKRLEEAEKSLDKKAKQAIEDVVVDEKAVAKRIADAYERSETQEDVKEYVPPKKADGNDGGGLNKDNTDSDAAEGKTVVVKAITKSEKKDTSVSQDDESDDDVKIFDSSKSKDEKPHADDKTIQAAFISAAAEKKPDEDLDAIPTIVAAQNVNKFNNEENENENDYDIEAGTQIKLEGFDENIDTVEKVDEEIVEKELEKRREKKVGKFRLFGPDETVQNLGETPANVDDYEKESEKDDFLDKLVSKRSALTVKMAVTVLLFIPALLMTAFKDSPGFPLWLSSNTAYFLTLTGLFVLTLIINFNVLTHGFNLKNGFNSDTPLSLAAVLVCAHTAVQAFDAGLWYDNGVALPAAVMFGIFMSQLSKRKMMSRLVLNFDFITGEKEKFTVENIVNNVDAQIIGRGIIDSDTPILKMSVKCDFPTNFLEISCKSEPTDRISKRIFVTQIIFCAVLFGAMTVFENINTAVNAALSAFVISLPVSAVYISNLILSDVSNQLSYYNSVVCGYEGAYMTQNADAVVMEAADFFAGDSCDLYGIKTFGGTKVDDAIIYAASVIVQTKSPLARVFDDIIIGKQSILPKVQDVTYEEKMGTSAWIYKKKVLVGTREMMKSHGITLPAESYEKKFTVKNRKALYLAIDGKLNAMFIVSYNAQPELKRELKKLEKTGITLIVKSSDPYINEESLMELFDLPEGFVRVMNYSAARVYDKYSNLDVEKSPAYIVHNGTALGLVSAVRASGMLASSTGLMSFLLTFGSVLGFAGIALLSAFGLFEDITAQGIIIYQLIWTVFSYIASRLKNLGV